jgi:hypothetical protein
MASGVHKPKVPNKAVMTAAKPTHMPEGNKIASGVKQPNDPHNAVIRDARHPPSPLAPMRMARGVKQPAVPSNVPSIALHPVSALHVLMDPTPKNSNPSTMNPWVSGSAIFYPFILIHLFRYISRGNRFRMPLI